MSTVSVIIPTYNRRQRVEEALQSVLDQTWPCLEVLVIDDGSTDATLASLARPARRIGVKSGTEPRDASEPLLRWLTTQQRGVSAARNEGIRRARGEWVAFLDSDDTWLPEKLARQMAALGKEPDLQICHCDEIWIRNGRRVNPRRIHRKYGGWIYQHCLPRCAISPSSVILNRGLFERVGLFDEALPACEDYDLWLRVCSRFPVLYLDEKLVCKTGGHEDQLSRTEALDRYRIQALAKILDSEELEDNLRRPTVETLRDKIEVYRAGVIKRGRLDEARELDRLAERVMP